MQHLVNQLRLLDKKIEIRTGRGVKAILNVRRALNWNPHSTTSITNW